MTKTTVALCAILGGLLGGRAVAADEGRPLRLIGEASAAQGSAPKRFFIEAVVTPGDAPFKSEVSGWLAALPPDVGSGELTGSCVENACALAADLDGGKLSLTGDLIAPAPGAGKYVYGDESQAGAVRFTVLSGSSVPDVGDLAPAGATTAAELTELLAWNGQEGGFNNSDLDGPPTDTERDSLASWQGSNSRPATGLILTADLKALRDGAVAAKAKAGWTSVGDAAHGWTAGYPAALLPVVARTGAEQRFASADGKAVLVISVEPARTGEAFDALVEEETSDKPGQSDRSYTRVNGDMEISYTLAGVRRVAAYHSREGGFARVVFTYPAGVEAYDGMATLVTRSLVATRDMKAP